MRKWKMFKIINIEWYFLMKIKKIITYVFSWMLFKGEMGYKLKQLQNQS